MRDISEKVSVLAFVLKDTELFLDTHPDDKRALEYYGKYRKLYEEALEEYERKVGPMTVKGVNLNDGWTWAKKPWPWETGE